jgi:hypothetical protein
MKISSDLLRLLNATPGYWGRPDGFDPAVARDLIEDLDESRRALNRIANDITLDPADMVALARETLDLPGLRGQEDHHENPQRS